MVLQLQSTTGTCNDLGGDSSSSMYTSVPIDSVLSFVTSHIVLDAGDFGFCECVLMIF